MKRCMKKHKALPMWKFYRAAFEKLEMMLILGDVKCGELYHFQGYDMLVKQSFIQYDDYTISLYKDNLNIGSINSEDGILEFSEKQTKNTNHKILRVMFFVAEKYRKKRIN